MAPNDLSGIDRANVLSGLWAIVLSLLLAPSGVTLGIACGAGLMVADLYALRRLVVEALGGGGRWAPLWSFLLLAKFAVFLGLAYALLRHTPMDVLAFGGGALLIVAVTVVVAAWPQRRVSEG